MWKFAEVDSVLLSAQVDRKRNYVTCTVVLSVQVGIECFFFSGREKFCLL
jgi:hypothetical protein